MIILSIDTSCDETSAAVTQGRKVLSNALYSQVLIHKKWGGVVPSLAKRAHEERIDLIVDEALKKAKMAVSEIDCIAVTVGPGLAVALEVGICKAKELALKYNKNLVSVNHLEGHIYSSFVQNRNGNPIRNFSFPYLAVIVSGGHTQIVVFKDHLVYEVLGVTIDDAAGEALDKAAKLLGLGYPGGAVLEKLAEKVGNKDFYKFPRPLYHSHDLQFSFSGLKTSLYYFLRKLEDQKEKVPIGEVASSFQEAVVDTIVHKVEFAINKTSIRNLLFGGGVVANIHLRKRIREMAKKYKGSVLFPSFPYLSGDNAAMIGVAAYFKADKGIFTDPQNIDRIPRWELKSSGS